MEKMLRTVLERVTPSDLEIRRQHEFAGKIIARIMKLKGRHVAAEMAGSNSRNTHLAGDHDLDIFVFYPETLPRPEFEKEGLRIGLGVFRGHKWEKAYSEHPYIRGNIEGFDVEIVPAYRVTHAEDLKSAVDRSIFHNEYMKQNMQHGQEGEIRLLKQFMKGVKCYGADQGANSFPGYVAELLTLKYGTFMACIDAAAKWEKGQAVDLENYYPPTEARKKFGSHLIVVDPVDRERNVAAALSLNQYARFIAACRAFIKRPSMNFFFPKPHAPWPSPKLLKFLQNTELVAVMLGYPLGVVEDVMWGQFRRFAKRLATIAGQNGFCVKRTAEWLEHQKHLVALLEVESIEIQKVKIVRGPEAFYAEHSEAFLKAHPKPLSGPRIEDGRWVIETGREYTNLEKLIAAQLPGLGRTERAGMRKALRQGARIMEEKDIVALYRKNRGFSQFLTGYLKGKEEFLDN